MQMRRFFFEQKCKSNGPFSHCCPCAHASQIDRKSLRTRISTESRDRSRSKGALFEFLSFKMALEGSPGRLGRPPGAILGSSWALLGRSWSALGRSWASKFSRFFQKCLKKLQICCLRGSWAALGSPPGDQSSISDPPRVDFDPPGDDFKAFPSSNSIAKLEQSLGKIMAKSMRKP